MVLTYLLVSCFLSSLENLTLQIQSCHSNLRPTARSLAVALGTLPRAARRSSWLRYSSRYWHCWPEARRLRLLRRLSCCKNGGDKHPPAWRPILLRRLWNRGSVGCSRSRGRLLRERRWIRGGNSPQGPSGEGGVERDFETALTLLRQPHLLSR